MIKKLIDTFLHDYFLDYNKKTLQLAFLSGNANFNNLYLNPIKINKILKDAKIPIRLKYGFIDKLQIKISLYNVQVEKIQIGEAVLILEPDSSSKNPLTEKEESQVYNLLLTKHILDNFENFKAEIPLNKLVNFDSKEAIKLVELRQKMIDELEENDSLKKIKI